MRRFALLMLAALTAGCTLDRSPLVPPGPDAGLDASQDSGMDAQEFDSGPELDAPRDAVEFDVPADVAADVPTDVPPDAPPCAPLASDDLSCDGIDDDCDERIDEGRGTPGVESGCASGGRCVALTIEGVAFQSCPARRGDVVWSGACRLIGPGYDLAAFDDVAQQDAVVAELRRAGRTEAHWVGVNDFEAMGSYVWRDRAPRVDVAASLVGAPLAASGCVALRPTDSRYEERDCAELQRVLCQFSPRVCIAESATCNGTDENCDGVVDEGCSPCATFTFWDRIYYRCSELVAAADVDGRCRALGGTGLTIDHPDERSFLAASYVGWTWLALRQTTSASTPLGNWSWTGSASTLGLPPTSPPWGGGEPNDGDGGENGAENCARARSDGFYDVACGLVTGYICERTLGR